MMDTIGQVIVHFSNGMRILFLATWLPNSCDSGFYLRVRHLIGALADRTLQILREPDLRRRLVANARQWVEQHQAWFEIGPRFVDLVERAAERRTMEGGRA